MKNRFKATVSALALTFMLLFGAAAFASTANASTGNPNMGFGGAAAARDQRWELRHHRRHHHRRHWRAYR